MTLLDLTGMQDDFKMLSESMYEDLFHIESPPSVDSISSGSSGIPYSETEANDLAQQPTQGLPAHEHSVDVSTILSKPWCSDASFENQLRNYLSRPGEELPSEERKRSGPSNRPLGIAPKRTRITYSGKQLLILEEAFKRHNRPVRIARKMLADAIKVSEKQIKVWFQNRRMKARKKASQPTENKSQSDKENQISEPHCQDSWVNNISLIQPELGSNCTALTDDGQKHVTSNGSSGEKFVRDSSTISTKTSQDALQRSNAVPTIEPTQGNGIAANGNGCSRVSFNEKTDRSLGHYCDVPQVDSCNLPNRQLYSGNGRVDWNLPGSQRNGECDISQYNSLQNQNYCQQQQNQVVPLGISSMQWMSTTISNCLVNQPTNYNEILRYEYNYIPGEQTVSNEVGAQSTGVNCDSSPLSNPENNYFYESSEQNCQFQQRSQLDYNTVLNFNNCNFLTTATADQIFVQSNFSSESSSNAPGMDNPTKVFALNIYSSPYAP